MNMRYDNTRWVYNNEWGLHVPHDLNWRNPRLTREQWIEHRG